MPTKLPVVEVEHQEGEAASSHFVVEEEADSQIPLRAVEPRPMLWWKEDKPKLYIPGTQWVPPLPTIFIPQCRESLRFLHLLSFIYFFAWYYSVNSTSFCHYLRFDLRYLSGLTRDRAPCALLATRVLDVLPGSPRILHKLMPKHFEDRGDFSIFVPIRVVSWYSLNVMYRFLWSVAIGARRSLHYF